MSSPSISPARRVVITGTVGLDKKQFLNEVAQTLTVLTGEPVRIFNVGDQMYAEDPSIPRGQILQLDRGRLKALRRAVMRDAIALTKEPGIVLLNTHATFRWRHGLFGGLDIDQLQQFGADLFINVIDNIDSVHKRMLTDHTLPHTLNDLLVWREEETVVSELVSDTVAGPGRSFITARGRTPYAAKACAALIANPNALKVYPSFPMTQVMKLPDVWKRICDFRKTLAEQFICFDPGEVDEFELKRTAEIAKEKGETSFSYEVLGAPFTFETEAVLDAAQGINNQIIARDFQLVHQSDIIIALFPELPDGAPAISAGVQSEISEAWMNGKQVYII